MPTTSTTNFTVVTGLTSFEACLAECNDDTCSHVTWNYDTNTCTTYTPDEANMVG
jgi:hypothetical protein